MDNLRMLTRYKAWADAEFYRCVADLSPEQLEAPQPILFGSLIRTMNHSYLMDYVWKANLLGQKHGLTSRSPRDCPDFDTLQEQQMALNDWFVEYSEALTDEQASQDVVFDFIGGGSGTMNRAEILHHLVNHNTYHRGHVADMLYHFNLSPPTTDLPVYLGKVRQGSLA